MPRPALSTEWGERLDPASPLPEYPRPQLVRGDWRSLNGPWQYAIRALRVAASDPLAVDDPAVPPADWDGEIIVPFSPETPLSGVSRTVGAGDTLWYRRALVLPRALRPGERAILHFGAVDQSCRVAVDGIEVGGHTGGYLPFALDVTAALGAGDTHDVVVAVRDVTDAAWLARGKQSSDRGGIWYTPQSGIWQSVWLEIVPRVAVDRLVLVPHLAAGVVEITVHAEAAPAGTTASVEVARAGETVATAEVVVGEPTRLSLPRPIRAWSPQDPFLYDVTIRLEEDTVTSYVGMRSFGVGSDARGVPRLLLNGEPHLPIGLLDQGYWPDGGYTAPSDAALVADIELAKRLGYTMLRKHIKVEPLRWYHHCDRLGMLVWQDAVNGGDRYRKLLVSAPAIVPALRRDDTRHAAFGRADQAGRDRFEAELAEMIEHLRSVPSISMWVPFNEAWGQFDAARIAAHVSALDPTRPVDHASGWYDQGAGDLQSLHIYFRPVRAPRRRDGRVLALTEYGGYSWPTPEHTWGADEFGYKRFSSAATLQAAILRLHDDEILPAVRDGIAALVYTQLSDVEDETNGLITYDRRVVKVDEQALRAVNDRIRAAAEGRA